MKKTTQLFAGLCLLVFSATQVNGQDYCRTYNHIDEIKASDPKAAAEIEQSEQELEAFTADFIAKTYPQLQSQRAAPYVIPVVFHVIHTNGSENISDDQIYDAIEKMNEDFNKQNNWNNVVSSFNSIVADCEIELKLAKKDNNGNCHKGITRTFSQTTHNGDNGGNQVDAVQNEHGFWPSTKYLNIFVVADAGGAAGYTTKPNNWGSASSMQKGIWILHDYVGRIGTSSPGVATALTHEVGHWLNLDHTWGGTNNPTCDGTATGPGPCWQNGGPIDNCDFDDAVNDTPNTIGWQSCNLSGTTCGASLDNVENFMEYSYCSKMYTEGQKARMHAALNSSTGGRDNIPSAANLAATGVNDPDILCKAEFRSNKQVICVGESIDFIDDSFHDVNGWSWTFSGGSPAASTDQNPTVTYNTPGTYQVSLEATDGSGTDTETKSAYITVLPEGAALPFIEDFESTSSITASDWQIVNQDGDAQFELYNGASASGGDKSVRLYNYGVGSDRVDELISEVIDLENVNPITMTFKYAYKKRNSNNSELLQVSFSNDCGETWAVRKNIQGNQLGDQTQSTVYNSPLDGDWQTVTLENISFTGFNVANFKAKFTFESDGGNNIFIDDINIYNSSVSTDDYEKIAGINVFPNPTTSTTNIEYSLINKGTVNISVVDNLGRVIYNVNKGQQIEGVQNHEIPSAEWANGVYVIRIKAGDHIMTKKLLKK